MKSVYRQGWLALVVFLCLIPSAFAAKPYHDRGCDDKHRRDCRKVPEGGSAIIYLLGAGITCAGAMLIRSRETKLNPSS
jgi:hypothetical protein